MTDELLQFGLLFGAGLAAGIINTLAGGGSLLTLPVLIFMGLPPHVANGTNRIGIVVQALIGSAGYRSKGLNPFPLPCIWGSVLFLVHSWVHKSPFKSRGNCSTVFSLSSCSSWWPSWSLNPKRSPLR